MNTGPFLPRRYCQVVSRCPGGRSETQHWSHSWEWQQHVGRKVCVGRAGALRGPSRPLVPSSMTLGSRSRTVFPISAPLPLLGELADPQLACWLEMHGQRSLAFLYRLSLSLSCAAFFPFPRPTSASPQGFCFLLQCGGQRPWTMR